MLRSMRSPTTLAICLVSFLATVAAAESAPEATPSPEAVPSPEAAPASDQLCEQVGSGRIEIDFDPLNGAQPRTCSAQATCGSDPPVSCVGNTTCSSYNEGCPLQWRGFVVCDGNRTDCPVNESCVAACEDDRAECLSECGGPGGGSCGQCHFAYLNCVCNCNDL